MDFKSDDAANAHSDRLTSPPYRFIFLFVSFARGASRGRLRGGAGYGVRARGSHPRSRRLGVPVRAHYGALPLSSAGRGTGERRETAGMERRGAPATSPEERPPRLKPPGWRAARRRAVRDLRRSRGRRPDRDTSQRRVLRRAAAPHFGGGPPGTTRARCAARLRRCGCLKV